MGFTLVAATPDAQARDRLLACCAKESGAWLHALPTCISAAMDLCMDNETIHNAIGLHLRSSLGMPHSCHPCGVAVDQCVIHGLSGCCMHAAINGILHKALTSANTPSRLEPSGGFVRSDGKKPDGITMVPSKNGCSLVWDVTYPDTFAHYYLALATSKAGRKKEDLHILQSLPHVCPSGH